MHNVNYKTVVKNMYKLFTDKAELFECSISLQGASLKKSKARLVVETPEYSLLFKGTISKSGKCEIPIRKLKGLIDETFFTPWESDFEVDTNKKVTVEVKSQTTKKPIVEAKVKVKENVTITEKQHVVNLLKLLIKEDININNITFKRNKLNNIVGTYLKDKEINNPDKIIGGVLKILERKT